MAAGSTLYTMPCLALSNVSPGTRREVWATQDVLASSILSKDFPKAWHLRVKK